MNSVLHSMIIDTNRRLLTEPFYQTQYSCTVVLFVRYWQGDWVPHSNTFCLFSAVEANTIVKSIFLPIPFLKELNKELNTAVLYGNYSYCFCEYLTVSRFRVNPVLHRQRLHSASRYGRYDLRSNITKMSI